MIGFLRGVLACRKEDRVLLDVHGVGYEVYTSARTQEQLANEKEITLYTHLQVREDAMTLYGFLSEEDLSMFRLLISVNGIGPKVALSVFDVFSSNDLKFAILSGDTKSISKAPGIGPKTAQRMVMELKDRVSLNQAFEERLQDSASDSAGTQSADEAVEGLIALGYSATEAFRAVQRAKTNEPATAEELIKAALKQLM